MNKFLVLLLTVSFGVNAQVQRHRAVTLMGSRFDITIVAQDSLSAEKYIDECVVEISRIEDLISEWRPQTQVSQINKMAGIAPVKADKELIDFTRRGLFFSELTDGAFDISFASLDKIWKFDGSMKRLPSEEEIRKSVSKIGYKKIEVDTVNGTIYLKEKGMKIGFGSIGKGYAADKTKALMQSKGVVGGIINASGDMNTWGKQADGSLWTVGITNPLKREKVFATLPLQDNAVVTSGNYEKFALIDGKRYTHIIDPRTGWPVSGIASVTVFGPDAESCNGFSTSIMVLGVDIGMALIDRYPAYKCIIVTDLGDVKTSKNVSAKPND